MSSMIKVFLLLAVAVCISKAQREEPGSQCLCRRVRNGIRERSEIKDVQIYPATVFCDKIEIVVTVNSGLRYCLNPKLKAVQRLLNNIMNANKKDTTAKPKATGSNVTPIGLSA